jgi:hypothetical protein
MNDADEPDWLAELRKGGEATERQIEALAREAMNLAQLVRRGWQKTGSPTIPYSLRLANAVSAAIREPVVRHVALNDVATAASTLVVAGVATASGSVPMPQVRVSTQAERVARQILALVLLWLVVLAVPAAVTATDLSPEVQAALDAYDGILAALAVEITFRILDKRK